MGLPSIFPAVELCSKTQSLFSLDSLEISVCPYIGGQHRAWGFSSLRLSSLFGAVGKARQSARICSASAVSF